ncbi:MAG: DUF2135 domain-containing protein, partial [Planctomycetes bacterium]|nr:DUF2135 domain-containing protein [Planctomycetota bacterium]
SSHAPDYAKARLESLVKQTPINEADLVVTMMWNTDRTDVDLHVVEPSGEVCFYQHTDTQSGGHITRDITQGFGPEMYTMKKAKAGVYTISANFYGNNSNRASVSTKVEIVVHRNFGTPNHTMETKVIDLGNEGKMIKVANLTIK